MKEIGVPINKKQMRKMFDSFDTEAPCEGRDSVRVGCSSWTCLLIGILLYTIASCTTLTLESDHFL